MRRFLSMWTLSLLLFAFESQGQEIVLEGPLSTPPPEYFAGAIPATLEWSYFASGGVMLDISRDGSRPVVFVGIGAELTFEVFRYHGFPSGCYGRQRGDAEIRLGPWLSVASRRNGGLVEGGMKVHMGGIYHASFGTWDLRFGTGVAQYVAVNAAHITATVAYGVRSVPHRYPDDRRDEWQPTVPIPARTAEAQVARLFVTFRRGFFGIVATEVVLGIELTPTFLLPPYSLFRMGGGPPR